MGGKIANWAEQNRFSRRRAADRRAHEARLLGSTGPAGPCKRLDPATAEVVAIVEPVEEPLSDAAARKRLQRQRDADGVKPVATYPKHDAFCEALIEAELLTEAETLNAGKVSHVASMILDEWAERWLKDKVTA